MRTRIAIGIMVITAWLGGASRADAVPFTLADANSTFSVETSTQAGAYSWTVNGTEELFKEWFWYRVGNTAAEKSIDTLPLISATASDTNANGLNDQLVLVYNNNQFKLTIQYNLTGGSTGQTSSKVTEQISITSEVTQLAMHFFAYSDFNLAGTPVDTNATRVNATTIRQTDSPGLTQETTTVSAAPSHFEIAFVPTTINKLNDASATTLSDGANSLGPGDVAYAFQFDQTLTSGSTFAFTQTKVIAPIPEPASLWLLSTGLAGFVVRRYRRAAKTCCFSGRSKSDDGRSS